VGNARRHLRAIVAAKTLILLRALVVTKAGVLVGTGDHDLRRADLVDVQRAKCHKTTSKPARNAGIVIDITTMKCLTRRIVVGISRMMRSLWCSASVRAWFANVVPS
jgi:hypothetical protein